MSVGPGRFRRYRKKDSFEVPATLAYPACAACGADWLTPAQLDELDKAFETYYKEVG